MRVLKHIKDEGIVKVVADHAEDLWHIERVIQPGDLVAAKSWRRFKTSEGESGEKKEILAQVRAEQIEFSEHANRVRVTGKIVAGGGAPEEAVARALRDFAQGFSGREQLAILAFAEAMEVIPRTLAENAGLDPIDILVELRAAHERGLISYGVDVYTGKIVDMAAAGVIEPLKIKTQAISSAAEAADLILRIDDVIAAGRLDKGSAMPPGGGMPPGMGEY